MKVIDFANWLSTVRPNYVVKTYCSNDFVFVVNESSHAPSNSDTCINFEGGISVERLISHIARHNLEGYTMYNSAHGDVLLDDIHVHGIDSEVYVR